MWRWQQRFAEAEVDGLLRDNTRNPGKALIPRKPTARVVALTCTAPWGRGKRNEFHTTRGANGNRNTGRADKLSIRSCLARRLPNHTTRRPN
jgi:hypothetical protein